MKMKTSTALVGIGAIAAVLYLYSQQGESTGAGGGGGGGTYTGNGGGGAGNGGAGNGTKKEDIIYRITSPLFAGTRELTGIETQGAGGILPGAVTTPSGNPNILIGTYGGEREDYFKSLSYYIGTSGSIYETKKEDLIAKYTPIAAGTPGGTWVLPVGAAGAVQEISIGGTAYGMGEGAEASPYGAPIYVKKDILTTSLGSLEGSGIVSSVQSSGKWLITTAAGKKYACTSKAGEGCVLR